MRITVRLPRIRLRGVMPIDGEASRGTVRFVNGTVSGVAVAIVI
jgi:hypothetical protein